MRPVAILIRVHIINGVESLDRPALELRVVGHQTSVDNKGHDSLTAAVIEKVVCAAAICRGTGKTSQATGGRSLPDKGVDADFRVGLQVGNLVCLIDLDGVLVVCVQRHGS